MAKPAVTCQTCNTGKMQRRKRYRMSGPVVVIGYILLIPSIIGIIVSVLLLFAYGGAASVTIYQLKEDTRQVLASTGVPPHMISKIIDLVPLSESEESELSDEQRRAVDDGKILVSTGMVGPILGGAFTGVTSVCMGVSFFVGGLLGWLLVMTKRILQCNSCGATVAAS